VSRLFSKQPWDFCYEHVSTHILMSTETGTGTVTQVFPVKNVPEHLSLLFPGLKNGLL